MQHYITAADELSRKCSFDIGGDKRCAKLSPCQCGLTRCQCRGSVPLARQISFCSPRSSFPAQSVRRSSVHPRKPSTGEHANLGRDAPRCLDASPQAHPRHGRRWSWTWAGEKAENPSGLARELSQRCNKTAGPGRERMARWLLVLTIRANGGRTLVGASNLIRSSACFWPWIPSTVHSLGEAFNIPYSTLPSTCIGRWGGLHAHMTMAYQVCAWGG